MAPISDIQRQTFTEIYKTYSGKLFGVCLHYVHDHDIACDLLHDSFIVIFSSLDQLRDSSRLEPWMCSIVRNIALKHLRNTKKMPQTSIDEIPEPSFEETAASISDIPLNELLRIVDELPEQYGKVFRLSVLDGLSHKEIGEIMGIAPHSSSSNLARAKNLLRKAVSKNWGILLSFCLCIIAVLFATRKEDDSYMITDNKVIWTISPSNTEIMIAELVPVKELLNLPDRKPTVQQEVIYEAALDESEDTGKAVAVSPDTKEEKTAEMPKETYEEYDYWTEDQDITDNRKSERKLTLGFSGNVGQSASSTVQGITIPSIDMTPYPPITDGNVNSGITDGTSTPPDYAEPEKPDSGTSQKTPDKHYRHAMPITFAATVRYSFTDRWAISSGLQYSYLHTDITEDLKTQSQDIHYIGIPLKMSCFFWKSASFNAYASAGMTLEFPVAGRMDGKILDVPCQWSAGIGVGLQYNITPHFGIYIEPEVIRYFDNGGTVKTIRTERPLNISIPAGIRFSW